MGKNFTPLHIDTLYPKGTPEKHEKAFESLPNTIFLILATLTVLIISIVLFVLIQKNLQGQSFRPISTPIASSGNPFYG